MALESTVKNMFVSLTVICLVLYTLELRTEHRDSPREAVRRAQAQS